ncbi:MAG TPA: MATE family efflux transporter [bacterium]|nr:MATE family efflux transporter [bacterium]
MAALETEANEAVSRQQPEVFRDLTSGDILGNVLYMGVPSMVGFASMTIYALISMFWVARIGTAEVAAVTLFSSFAAILGAVNSMVGSGSVAVISRRFGERDFDGTANAVKQTMVMKFSMGLPMAAAGYLLAGHVLRVMTSDQRVISLGVAYARVYFLGLPFMFTMYTVYTALRGIGEAPRAMYIMLATTALNMGLDPLLIFKFGLGVRGAALGSALSAATAVTVGLLVLRFGQGCLRTRMRGFRTDPEVMGQVLRIGLPPFVESLSRSAAVWVFAIFVATYGVTVVAAYGIVTRVVELGAVFAVGLELGASAIVGQNMGAGKPERAAQSARKAALLALGIALGVSTLEVIFGREIMQIFGRATEVKALGAYVLVFFAIAQPMSACAVALASAFYGSGHTWPPMIAALTAAWVVQIPLAGLCVHVFHLPTLALWLVVILANVVLLSVMVAWFRRGTWKRGRV